jgi:transcriptional regulator with XRE-family HTH domain
VVKITKEQIEALKKGVGVTAERLRIRAGFDSVPKAAAAMGVQKTTLYDLEKGDNFLSPEMAIKLSAAYGVSPRDLMPADDGEVAPVSPDTSSDVLARVSRILSTISQDTSLLEGIEIALGIETAADEDQPATRARRRSRR